MKCRAVRGTCEDPCCEFYGFCHCACGAAPTVSPQNRNTRHQQVKGQPFAYVHGHCPSTSANLAMGAGSERHTWPDVRSIEYELTVLVSEFGPTQAARAAGVNFGTVWAIRTGRRTRVSPATARRIKRAMSQLETQQRSPLDPQRLRRFVENTTLLEPADARGYFRALQKGWITWDMADRISCALGLHMGDIWGYDVVFEEAS